MASIGSVVSRSGCPQLSSAESGRSPSSSPTSLLCAIQGQSSTELSIIVASSLVARGLKRALQTPVHSAFGRERTAFVSPLPTCIPPTCLPHIPRGLHEVPGAILLPRRLLASSFIALRCISQSSSLGCHASELSLRERQPLPPLLLPSCFRLKLDQVFFNCCSPIALLGFVRSLAAGSA